MADTGPWSRKDGKLVHGVVHIKLPKTVLCRPVSKYVGLLLIKINLSFEMKGSLELGCGVEEFTLTSCPSLLDHTRNPRE